jgi:ubiquinone/menaquinone biosynthesis C-methylase UbiE
MFDDYVRNMLNVYWIRPETAIWRSLDVAQLQKIKMKEPVLDLGCGNGAFAFTLNGGKCDESSDIFNNLGNTKGYLKGVDIYNQSATKKPKIITKPRKKIQVGLDHKQGLLDNAKQYGVYEKLIQHDLNKKLPFEDESFNTIFSNVFYWIKNIKQLFTESNRVLKKNGKLIICVPDLNHKKTLIYNTYLKTKAKWAKDLDRGNYFNMQQCLTFNEWKKIIEGTGFKIEKHEDYLSTQFIQFCQIAMRPYSPYMIEMANRLDPKIRKDIKKRLLNEITPLISSYIKYEKKFPSKFCFHFFVLKKV